VLAKPEQHTKSFTIREGLIWTPNLKGLQVLCLPRDRALLTQVLTQAHEIVGHFGGQRTCKYIRHWYWWPRMAADTNMFCKICKACQQAKAPTHKPTGLLHPLPIPTKPWDSVGTNFIGPFPEAKGFNYLWVVICRMTSMVHLIPVHTKLTASDLSWIYMCEVVWLHGLPGSLVSNRDSKFTSRWWRELHRIMGAKLLMSTSFHPQTDVQTEHTNRSIGQILWAVVSHDQKNWIDKIDMVEFAINLSISETTGYSPFELNYGYMPSMIKEIRNDKVVSQGI